MKHESRVANLVESHESLLVKLVHHEEQKLPAQVRVDQLEEAYERLGQYVMVLTKRPADGK